MIERDGEVILRNDITETSQIFALAREAAARIGLGCPEIERCGAVPLNELRYSGRPMETNSDTTCTLRVRVRAQNLLRRFIGKAPCAEPVTRQLTSDTVFCLVFPKLAAFQCCKHTDYVLTLPAPSVTNYLL